MSPTTDSKSTHVLAAVAALLFLAGLLAARLGGQDRASAAAAPAADVAEPRPAVLAELEVPCWGCREAVAWPVEFKTDLDLLAPLGSGSENAAVWFKDFTKPTGPRYGEARDAMERRVTGPDDVRVLPPDDPLLVEAEPWCDQAVMRFYPDFLPLQGALTTVPNLLLPLSFARSWVARGRALADPAEALEDYRRAIRLGRLLRQEDVTIIADLVGLACIRFGAEAIFDHARDRGDTELALVASLVLGEVAPQRLLTSERVTSVQFNDYMVERAGSWSLTLPERVLDGLLSRATTDRQRRFRGEAITVLNLVYHLAPAEQSRRARTTLDQLAAGGDPVDAAAARWSIDHRPEPDEIVELMGQPVK